MLWLYCGCRAPRELLVAMSCYSVLWAGPMGTWDGGGALPSWKGRGGVLGLLTMSPHPFRAACNIGRQCRFCFFQERPSVLTSWHRWVPRFAARGGRWRTSRASLARRPENWCFTRTDPHHLRELRSRPAGSLLRGVQNNGGHANPHLQDRLEPAERALPEKSRRGVRGTAALWWLLGSLHGAQEPAKEWD